MRRQQQDLGQDATPSVSAESPDAWLAPLFLDERTDAYVDDEASTAKPEPPSDPAAVVARKSQVARQLGMGNPLGAPRVSEKGFLPMTLEEYLQLLDWMGREIRADKRGAIPADLQPILERLQI